MARIANWILTFDDGPLPSDLATWTVAEPELLDPLSSILQTLSQEGIQAVFYLRGPQFPWLDQGLPRPSDALFATGVQMITSAGHHAAVHCFSHNPALWRTLVPDKTALQADLDAANQYFGQFGFPLAPICRLPYGGFSLAAELAGKDWCRANGLGYREWSLDPQDWLHHPDNTLPLHTGDAAGHLELMRWNIALNAPWHMAPASRRKDVLLHVSHRTATHLPALINQLRQTSALWNRSAEFSVPAAYLAP